MTEEIYEAREDFNREVEEALATLDSLSYVDPSVLCPDTIAKLITFENCHLVIHALVMSDQAAARGCLGELLYWQDANHI